MQSNVFSHVPGTKSIEIYPFIRKIDLMSSNSYILSTPNQISLIDPGGLPDQATVLANEISHLNEMDPRPLIIYLTHVHMDHWFQISADNSPKIFKSAALAVQDEGATALETNDNYLTLSNILGKPMKRMSVDIHLLSKEDTFLDAAIPIDICGHRIENTIVSRAIPDGPMMHVQRLMLGNDDVLEIYHTPGHSPDSVCIRAGSLLFVGDLFFAPNPGMAGAFGWSRMDLLESIQRVRWIVEYEGITECLSGHGRSIEADVAKKTLAALYRDAAALGELARIDVHWAKSTANYALDIIQELERVFTIITGRIAFASHIIAELDLSMQSKKLDSLIDAHSLDMLFVDFHRFNSSLIAGNKLDLEMVHKAGQVVVKLEKLFEKNKLDLVMDKSILDRASRLLSDYSVVYRGYRPPYYVSVVLINGIIEGLIDLIMSSPYDDESIIFSKSEEEYLEALNSRIAHLSLFDDIKVVFFPCPENPMVRMDKERFNDNCLDIFERYRACGWKEIEIRVSTRDEWAVVCIRGRKPSRFHPLESSKRFFERSFALCGALMETAMDSNGPVVEIELFIQSDLSWK